MKVCILGSGLSALALAKALVNENIFVDVVYENKNYEVDVSRTIGISKSNSDFFNKNIINIEKISWKLDKIEIYSDSLKKEKILNFENNKEQLFSIIKNYKLYEMLDKSLSSDQYFKKLKYKKKVKFDQYNLIINTDYASFFTKKYFYKKIQKSYDSLAYTSTMHHESISNYTATQIFTKIGPLAFLPISKKQTSIVFSIKGSKKNQEKNINELIYKYNFKYKIKKIDKINSFELKSLFLRSYYHENILAFGDLLHRIHPLAGQGFNMTIRDINVLTQIIKKKSSLGLPLDSSVNKEFEIKMRHNNYIFYSSIDFIYEFFNLERKLKNKTLSRSVKFLGKNPSINKLFKKIADKGIYI